jgi:galactokinase
VVYENGRVIESRRLLCAGDLEGFGRLMNASHESARDLYEVSCAELEAMVRAARRVPGVLGSRMAGAGFGGCTVSLAPKQAVDEFRSRVSAEYQAETGIKPTFYVCAAVDGASVVTG